ncbi:hypothetical protein EFA69_04245 [Rufibacter immobilis]|uniref:Uncharacterized protein n=1 Tax=Rufibacter immobilis TaxID=1348778 RepID=A0A3M9N474_9BACT|nr:hypothetical protein EFA69_04245 [Rufibacter immobilis]
MEKQPLNGRGTCGQMTKGKIGVLLYVVTSHANLGNFCAYNSPIGSFRFCRGLWAFSACFSKKSL